MIATPQPRASLEAVQNPVSSALHPLRLSRALCCLSELRGEWSIEMPTEPGTLMFHIATSGSYWLEVEGVTPHELRPDQLALVSHGEGHVIASDLSLPSEELFALPVERVSERYEILRYGAEGERTTLICGFARVENPIAARLVASLPPLVHIDALATPQGAWLQQTLRLMTHEASVMQPGGETVVARLADVLVIQALRLWMQGGEGLGSPWLRALHDPQIGQALALIHEHPGHPWSVGELAERVAMSRSSFSARFSDVVEQTPMQYLTEWRMTIALSMLTGEEVSVAEVAEACGYGSEAAFSRAFKREVGVPPGAAARGAEVPARWAT